MTSFIMVVGILQIYWWVSGSQILTHDPRDPSRYVNPFDPWPTVSSDSAAYISQTRDQQRFRISEVAAEPMVPQHIIWSSIARANGQLDPRCS